MIWCRIVIIWCRIGEFVINLLYFIAKILNHVAFNRKYLLIVVRIVITEYIEA